MMNGTTSLLQKFEIDMTSGHKVQSSNLRQNNSKSQQGRTQGAFSNSVRHEWID